MAIQITGIHQTNANFDNPYLAINSLIWVDDYTKNGGISTRDVLFDWINDNGMAYILDEYGNKARLLTATTKNGYKYVKTAFDETKTDKLLCLLDENK